MKQLLVYFAIVNFNLFIASHFHSIYFENSFVVNHKVLQTKVYKQIDFIKRQKRQEAWLLFSSRKWFLSEVCFLEFSLVISKWQVDETFPFEFILIARNYLISPLSSPWVSYSCTCNIIWIGNILHFKKIIHLHILLEEQAKL